MVPGPFATMYSMFSDEDRSKLSDMNGVLREIGAQSLREVLSKTHAVRYARGCDIVAEEVWAIPLYDGLSIVAYNGGLQGAEPRPLAGIFYFNEWSF